MNKIFKTINCIKVCLLSILMMFGLNFDAQASHYAAADIHIDYIPTATSPYTYRVTLNVYKSCEGGATLGTTATMTWASASGCLPGDNRDMGTPTIDTLDQLCDTFKAVNSCRPDDLATSKIFPAFIRHTWVLEVTLPGPCPDWVFGWREGNRNGAILNLDAPSSQFIFVNAMINNSKKARVNTPRYTVDPIPYFCLNSKSVLPNGPVDPDLDSMVSLNVQARNLDFPLGILDLCDFNTAVSPPYSLTVPIRTDPLDPYAVDPNTGTATFTPTLEGKYVLAFQTLDYDRTTKELMGFTTRDVQVAVLGCLAPPPTPDDDPTNYSGCYYDTLSSTVFACPEQPMRFDVGATSNSLTNMIYARWDLSSLPGATYTASGDGTKRVVGTLNWTPTKAHVGRHTIKLRFVDSTCSLGQPLVTESIYVVIIEVLPSVDGGKDGIYCVPGGAAWQMQTVDKAGMRYKWTSISGSPTMPPPFMDDDTLMRPRVEPAVYTSYLVEGSIYRGPYRCTTKDTVDVKLGTPSISIEAGPEQIVCANKPISLKASISPMSELDSLNWTPNSTLDDSTILNPIATPYITTLYVLYAQDKNGCGYTDTAKVTVDGFYPNISPKASRDTVCPEGFTQLFSNVSQQPCGIAQTSCIGGESVDKIIGTGIIGSTAPTPFYNVTNSAGERMQILYRRDELLDAGIKAGFINSMSFNLPAKNTTDSFYKFSIKMACTPDASMSGSTMSSYPGTSIVLPPQSIYTETGWNTFTFPSAYYWDGSSNLLVEVCWSKVYGAFGGTPEPVFATNTSYTSVKYIRDYTLPAPAMGEGCGLTAGTPLLSSTRPNTRFNVCIPASIFKYSWTPTSYLNQPDSSNTNVDGIKEDTDYTITVTAASNPNCFSTGVVPIKVDRTNSVSALPLSPVVHCRPGYFYDLTAIGNGPRPLRNLTCGTNDTVECTGLTTRNMANPSTFPMVAEPLDHAFNGVQTTAHTQYIIPNSALRNGNMTSGTIRTIAIEAVTASTMDFTNLKIGMKCTDTKQFSATPPVTFETGAVPVYSSVSEVFSTGGYHVFTLSTPYNWDTSKNLLIDFCYAQAAAGTGPTINSYRTPGFNLMVQSYQTSGDVCSNPSTEIGPKTFEMIPIFQLGFCSAGDTDFTFRWSPGDYFQDSLKQNPIVSIDSTVKLYVQTRGRNGCLVRDSVTIFVPKNKRFVTQDTIICLNESTQLRSYYGTKTKWYETNPTTGVQYDVASSLSCDTCERTIAKPKVNTTYYAAVTDENGCVDTFRTSITVKPLLGVTITNRDTVIKYGKSVVLNVFGGTGYVWTPLAGLSNPNSVSPTATPLVTTVYRVVGFGTNGCRSDDSVKITIDYKSPISIPTAFTPNGDGKNDKFRLMGVTFQTLMEFRVYNRWGEEVFSTNDINGGWDGTFKGKLQDMGAYNYIIRVGYPDGDAQTFKGDVTLIR